MLRKRFKSMLYFIFMLILTVSALGVGYIFYDKITSDSDIVVDGKITINYLDGKKFSLMVIKVLRFLLRIMIQKQNIITFNLLMFMLAKLHIH